MEITASLPAAPGRCSAHHRDELVVPLLLAVVHEAEKLADAHVVCLRRGAWVSGAASSVRAAPADQCAIIKRQTDFQEAAQYEACEEAGCDNLDV